MYFIARFFTVRIFVARRYFFILSNSSLSLRKFSRSRSIRPENVLKYSTSSGLGVSWLTSASIKADIDRMRFCSKRSISFSLSLIAFSKSLFLDIIPFSHLVKPKNCKLFKRVFYYITQITKCKVFYTHLSLWLFYLAYARHGQFVVLFDLVEQRLEVGGVFRFAAQRFRHCARRLVQSRKRQI